MREFEFECRLCAHLEGPDRIVARQLGAGVGRSAGRRVMDIVVVEAGPELEDRLVIGGHTIPQSALEASLSVGGWRATTRVFDEPPERARDAADRAAQAGFVERARRGGRDVVRQAVRYPANWFRSLIGVENKPDLGSADNLQDQLRTDVSVGVFDRIVVATESYVTGVHRHRIPDEVGIWRLDFEDPTPIEVIREPSSLPHRKPGIQPLERRTDRTDIKPVSEDAKTATRRRIAERAYGKGWRPDMPPCAHASAIEADGTPALPHCEWYDRVVDPGRSCGPNCGGFESAAPLDIPSEAERKRRQAWEARSPGTRRQSRLDRFSGV